MASAEDVVFPVSDHDAFLRCFFFQQRFLIAFPWRDFSLFSIPVAFFHIAPSIACYVIVAVIWFIPSKGLEKAVEK